jgi:hypothetical protein
MSPEVAFSVQYIPKVHLERLRSIPDAVALDGISGSVVVGPRQEIPVGDDNWVLLAQADNGKSSASSIPVTASTTNSLCGKNDRRFPFTAEIGPDLQLRKFRITLPLVITRFGDQGTRTQYSFRFGVDFSFGRN